MAHIQEWDISENRILFNVAQGQRSLFGGNDDLDIALLKSEEVLFFRPFFYDGFVVAGGSFQSAAFGIDIHRRLSDVFQSIIQAEKDFSESRGKGVKDRGELLGIDESQSHIPHCFCGGGACVFSEKKGGKGSNKTALPKSGYGKFAVRDFPVDIHFPFKNGPQPLAVSSLLDDSFSVTEFFLSNDIGIVRKGAFDHLKGGPVSVAGISWCRTIRGWWANLRDGTVIQHSQGIEHDLHSALFDGLTGLWVSLLKFKFAFQPPKEGMDGLKPLECTGNGVGRVPINEMDNTWTRRIFTGHAQCPAAAVSAEYLEDVRQADEFKAP